MAVLLVPFLAFCTGCGKKTDTVRLAQFLTDPILIAKLNNVVQDIEKRHPGLHIEVDNIPYNEYQQKITTQMASGLAPDVIYVEVNNFVDLYLRGAFEDLTPYCQKDSMDMKDYYEGVLRRFSPDGKIYAIPQDTAPIGLIYYNRKLFRDAGVDYPKDNWTWPEPFLSVCQKLTKKDAKGHVTQWAFVDAYDIQFEDFLFGNGADYVDNTDHPTRMTLDTPAAMEAILYRWSLIQKYHVSPDAAQIQTFSLAAGQMDMFLNGQAAMLCSGIWQTPRFMENKNLDFDVVEFPQGPHGGRGWGTGGSGYALSKASKNKDLAWLVIKEMTSAPSISQLAQTGMIQPASKSLANSDVFLKSPGAANKAILLQMPQYSHYQPFLGNWSEIYYGLLRPALDPIWAGTKTPEEVVPVVNKTINEKFFNNKK
jgi:ABC-type glycerol-3-phosphate transport system substrate-binding protein